MIICNNIRLGVDSREEDAIARAMRKTGLRPRDIADSWINRVSVDARHNGVKLVYSVGMVLVSPRLEMRAAAKDRDVRLKNTKDPEFKTGKKVLEGRPVVVGFGPAGLFRALVLARMGMRPIVLERGGSLEERLAAVERFEREGVLCAETNVQFGEGGAGTFSDGKLTTRINDDRCDWVLRELVKHGAPEEILKKARPHIGTDLLTGVVRSIREDILSMGGKVLFNTKMTDLLVDGGRLTGVRTEKGDVPAEIAVLATGHSARDTFGMLERRGAVLKVKPFSVGVRIEHLQSEIDRSLYHELAGHPALPAGEYQISYTKGDRGVYTFCMCPGGSVVAARSEERSVVTNGMSRHSRNGKNANSALVVSVSEADFGGDYRKAIAFQRELEERAFRMGGGDYSAPVRTVGRFMDGKPGYEFGRVLPTYPIGIREADLDLLFPGFITRNLREALPALDRKIAGFAASDSVLTGPETRTSSPVRILRNEELLAGIPGVYPAGEGAGYAGGIMSAAVDGVRVAQQICSVYRRAD